MEGLTRGGFGVKLWGTEDQGDKMKKIAAFVMGWVWLIALLGLMGCPAGGMK